MVDSYVLRFGAGACFDDVLVAGHLHCFGSNVTPLQEIAFILVHRVHYQVLFGCNFSFESVAWIYVPNIVFNVMVYLPYFKYQGN